MIILLALVPAIVAVFMLYRTNQYLEAQNKKNVKFHPSFSSAVRDLGDCDFAITVSESERFAHQRALLKLDRVRAKKEQLMKDFHAGRSTPATQ